MIYNTGILKDVSFNESIKQIYKGSMSANKKQQNTNNLSLLNASLNLNKLYKFDKKKPDYIVTQIFLQDKHKLNFSIENKLSLNVLVLTPKMKKNNNLRIMSKENSILRSEKTKPPKPSQLWINDGRYVIQKYIKILNSQEIEELSKISEVYFLGSIISVIIRSYNRDIILTLQIVKYKYSQMKMGIL